MTNCLKAPPISRGNIKAITSKIRSIFGVDTPYFPVDYVFEATSLFLPDYQTEILSGKEMGDNHGLTLYELKIIQIRDDVYEGACEGKGRDRMTIAHEIGHAVLHTGTLASARDFGSIKLFEDPEWQAKAFAGHLLIPDDILGRHDMQEVAEICKVSLDAAQVALRTFQRDLQKNRG
jgi:Zn-dependent peptidase ImmA (M78 family)